MTFFRCNMSICLAFLLSILFLLGFGFTISNFSLFNEGYSYHMGGWDVPYGIELSFDAMSWVFALFILIIGFAVSLYFPNDKTIPSASKVINFPVLLFFYIAGNLAIVFSNDLFNIYVCLEITSLLSYTLTSISTDKRSYNAAFNYLIIGTISATFYLLGVGLLYAKTGTLNLTHMSEMLKDVDDIVVYIAAFLTIIGLVVKAGIVPVHYWLVRNYNVSCFSTVALFSATSSKVAIYMLLKVIFLLYGDEIFNNSKVGSVIYAIAIISIVNSAINCAFSNSLRKILAYSSLVNISYILLAVLFRDSNLLSIAFIHMMLHGLAKCVLFMVMGYWKSRFLPNIGSLSINSIGGIYKISPILSFMFVITLLGLMGFPFTFGFLIKWNILAEYCEVGDFLCVFVILLSSVFSFHYTFKIVQSMYSANDSLNEFTGENICNYKYLFMIIPIVMLFFVANFSPLKLRSGIVYISEIIPTISK